ncbi:S9 family peptidase [Schaalia sp. ZJ405]|uniref:S9 family peptidase n=1 Tax=Schaalia sp. ZJ405 TaxID=2709403 RepID=UPI002F2B4543
MTFPENSSHSSDSSDNPTASSVSPLNAATAQATTNTQSRMTAPPVAAKRLGVRVRSLHSDRIDDGWDWLRDGENPEVIAHLNAENTWTDQVTHSSRSLAQEIVRQVRAHTILTDVSVPVRAGDYWYFSRWTEGDQYRRHYRVAAQSSGPMGTNDLPPTVTPGVPLDGEELIIDENALALGHEFFRLADLVPSPDGAFVAWAADWSGDERYRWHITKMSTGEVIDSGVDHAGYGFAWAASSQAFLYVGVDDAWRAHQVWLHTVGSPQFNDRLLLEEEDPSFDIEIVDSLDPEHVVISSSSLTSSQAWLWIVSEPTATPLPITGPMDNVLISVEPAGDHLVLVHSARSREGCVALAPLPHREELLRLSGEQELLLKGCAVYSHPSDPSFPALAPIAPEPLWWTLRQPRRGERVLYAEAGADYLAVTMRSGGLTQVEVRMRSAIFGQADDLAHVWGPGRFLATDADIRTISTVPGARFEDRSLRVEIQSVTAPPTTLHVNPITCALTTLRVRDVPGWDPSHFVEERAWVLARDGRTRIPVTLIHRSDVTPDFTNPGWLLGYGAYEISYDPEFDTLRLPLLERGVVFAIAHVRGGGEMGRSWYEDGRQLSKVNSFTDFIDVAQWLTTSGWVASERLAAEGRSAGGLLMGAVLNMAPSLFRVIVAGVPFVDALTTILDPTLPLTVGEWQEWGNPVKDPQVYALMRSYSPYENVPQGQRLPAVFASTSLNDTRVEFVEPTKWVQRLREATGTANAIARPIVLRTEMVAGHSGPSGREGRWACRAQEFAFTLTQLGITE